jgi:hypothetical protein
MMAAGPAPLALELDVAKNSIDLDYGQRNPQKKEKDA